LIVRALAQSRRDGHRSLVTPERVLSEYNQDLIFFFDKTKLQLNICAQKYKPSFPYGILHRSINELVCEAHFCVKKLAT